MIAISFSNVSVYRGHKNALTNVSLDIKSGENIAIVGPNGSGKSTLIKTITRELYPTNGSVRLFGRETWDVFELRARLGVVSYDIQSLFMQEITGEDVVLSGFFSSIGLWKNNRVTPAMRKQAARVMKWLNIARLKNEILPHLSSGEARRFLIARALVHGPKLIVFDEPMNSLDLGAQSQVKQTLRKLARSGVGVVLVTHHLSDIIPEINRVILLRNGKIAADGSKNSVLTEHNLKRLFGADVGLIKKGGYFHAY